MTTISSSPDSVIAELPPVWRPQAGPQLDAISKWYWVDELLYGGSRGGGKSYCLLLDFAQEIPKPGGETWHGIVFRRTTPQLEELIKASHEIYPQWFGKKVQWSISTKTWHWENGASLKMRYAEREDDWINQQGHSYQWIAFDELTSWATPELYMKMKATLRSANRAHKYKRIRATANPGGVGHEWVKAYFAIDRYPMGGQLLKNSKGRTRIYIKSRLYDNKLLMAAQPEYVDTLKDIGSPELVKAWLDGDWDLTIGAYFPEFSTKRHVLPAQAAYQIPHHWTRLVAMDWGGHSPGCITWGAVSDGRPFGDDSQFCVPKGAIVVYREWYTGKKTDAGSYVGLMLSNAATAEGILEREAGEEVNDRVIDPACYAQHGGPSIAEEIARASKGAIMFRRADNQRIPGWQQIRSRLIGNAASEGKPLLYVTENCIHTIRTIPSLQIDMNKPEDVNSDGDDHAGDALRYLVMARPYTRDQPKIDEPTPTGLCLDDLWPKRRRF